MSQLLTIYRALFDDQLGNRIQGALIKYASYLMNSNNTDIKSLGLARLILDRPTDKWQDFNVQVITDAGVLSSIRTTENGGVDSSHVSDATINYIVEIKWASVAEKFIY